MTEPWGAGGAGALQDHAPTAAVALAGLATLWPAALSDVQLRAIRSVTAEALGLTPLRPPRTGPRRGPEEADPAVVAFAEQYAADVTLIDAPTRAAWLAATGHGSDEAGIAVYVADVVPRVRAVLGSLFGGDVWFDTELTRSPYAALLVDELVHEVALLDSLDDVTTELIRLRVARQHGSRICMARRNLAAMRAGADAATFVALDRYRGSALPPAQQAALALVDGLVWTPADLREQDVAAVHTHLTPAQAVEVVLDVAVHFRHKTPVALGTDEPEVDGVQLFELDERGALVFP